jgi:hypothetical protein
MTHDQIREMVRKANPVGDPTSLEQVTAPDPTIGEWRMDMQTEDRTVTQTERNRWRGPMIGIAAAVMVLVGGLVYYLTSRDTAEVAEPAPNATRLPGEFTPIAPGAYFIDTDGDGQGSVRGTFVIERDGWSSIEVGLLKGTEAAETDVSLFVVEVDEVASPGCHNTEWVPAGATAESLADQFATLPGLVIQVGLAPVTAFGHEGYHMVVTVPDEGYVDAQGFGGCEGDGLFDGWMAPVWGHRLYQAPGQMLEFWFLDVEGAPNPIMVEAATFPTSSDDLRAELEAVLDTLVITP